ncbi:MAG: putative metal-dependent phosphoesterase TrpH [Patiriisocius sp.]
MKADLHCHSHYSDGTQPIPQLLARAIANQVTHLAITDHDCITGLHDIPADLTEITIIKGVEISCQWDKIEVHIVGLHIDPQHTGLIALLESQQNARRWRVEMMDEKLTALGHEGLMEYLHGLPCVAYTRSHVANYLVEQSVCKNRPKSFKTHLGKGGKIYVPSQWCSLAEGVAAIRAAGGIAVLAHPGRYPLNKAKLGSLVTAFEECGGEALEGSYPNIHPNAVIQMNMLARKHGLYLSAGSDFHDPVAKWTDIGKFPPLDPACEINIWHHPRW